MSFLGSPTPAPTQSIPLEDRPTCYGCGKSVVLFHELHCTKSAHAEKLTNVDTCPEFKDLGDI